MASQRGLRRSNVSCSGAWKKDRLTRYCTTCCTGFDLLLPKSESPPYTAVTGVVPTLSVEVIKTAEPPLKGPVPSTVLTSTNETASPSGGAPALEVTTAVNVTASPSVDGFGADVRVVVVASPTMVVVTV